MVRKILPLVFGVGLAIWVAQVQSQLLTGTPHESLSPPKLHTEKPTEATPPVKSSASPLTSESPAAASPTPKRIRKRAAEASPTPTPTPVASPTPRKFRLRFPRLFKSRRSPTPA